MSQATDKRTRQLAVLCAGVFGLTILSQAWVQVFHRSATLALAKEKSRYVVSRMEFARRGSIFSSDGTVLAQGADSFELSLRYDKVPITPGFFVDLARASGIPAIELRSAAVEGSKSKTWQEAINPDRAREIQDVKTLWRADGVSLKRVPRREYPLAEIADSIVGHLDPGMPATGLEASQERILAGMDGLREGLVDRRGAFLPMRMTENDRRASDGSNITLTIDSDLQTAATTALKKAVESNLADSGVAIIIEPTTGKILALASWLPGQSGDEGNGFNPAIMARYEPGSTFKTLTLGEGLELGVIQPSDTVHCGGSIMVGGKAIHCAHDAHGTIDTRQAISRSCNVSAAQWALKIGNARMIKFLNDAGLVSLTNVGMPGEIPGLYNPNDGSPSLQVANMGFGQAVNVTPIALIAAFNAMASHGVLAPPRLIDRVGSKQTEFAKKRQLFSPEIAQTLLDDMIYTFEDESGTAHRLRIPGYTLGGKTGTAQKLGAYNPGGKKQYVSNFLGFVPGDRPAATVLVMIDNPKAGAYYGASVAGPVFKEIAEALIKRYNLPRTRR